PQRNLPRSKRRGADHRRGAGVAGLLRQTRDVSDASGVGDPRRNDPLAERSLSAQISRSREAAPRSRPQADARSRKDRSGPVRSRRRHAANYLAISENIAQRAILRGPRAQTTARDLSRDTAQDR